MSVSKFKFSIIIVVYNSEKYLKKSIDSVINQDLDFRDNIQLILVDCGSLDNSKEICSNYQKNYSENIQFFSKDCLDIASARNIALKNVDAEYVNFLDAGDYLSRDTLIEINEFFNQNVGTDVVAIPIKFFGRETSNDFFNYKFGENKVIDLNKYPNNPIFTCSSVFIKTSAINDNFNEDLVYGEDILFLYNILIKNSSLGLLDAPTYYLRKTFDLSKKSETIKFKKEYYTHRFEKLHLKLIENSKIDDVIPKFIQYFLFYDLKDILTQDELFMCDCTCETEKLFNNLNKIIAYIDDEIIAGEDSLRYLFYKFKYPNLMVDFNDYDASLKDNGNVIGNVNTPEIIIDRIDLKDDFIKFSGFLNEYLNKNNYSIEALVKSKNSKTKRFSCEFLKSPNYIGRDFSSIYQNNTYFELNIPIEDDDFEIMFKTLYHMNGDKSNYVDENLIVFNPDIDYLCGKYHNKDLYEINYDDYKFKFTKKYDFKIAIVMAIYNTENYLYQSIDSVINQTIGFEDNIQLILVNDGSEDSSLDILKEYYELYPENIIIVDQVNQGQAHARNNGFEYVKSKYVNFLDSDDYLEENALKEAYGFFEQHFDETDIVSMPIIFFEKSTGNHMLNNKYSQSRVIDLTFEPNNPQLHSNSAFFKSDVFRKYKFATNVVSSEDVIVINKILLEKKTLGVIDTSKYYYRKRYDESSTLDMARNHKEFFTDKLRDYYLHLFEYALTKEGSVPSFLKYTLAYDLQWVLKEDLSILNTQEKKEFWFYLNEVLRYIDDGMIISNQYIRNEFTKKFFLAIKRNDLHTEFLEDTVILKIGDYICDDLSIHRIWLDIVELQDGFLNISGFLNSFFDNKYISIEAVKYLDSVAFDKFRAEYVKYTKRPHLSFLSKPFQFKNTFDLKIPLERDEKSKIKIRVNYHKDGNNNNFYRENLISVELAFKFTNHVKISELSFYKSNDSHIVYLKDNAFHVTPYSINAVKKIEKENISLLEELSNDAVGDNLEQFSEIINLRKKYLSKYPNFNLFGHNKEIYIFQDRIDVADDNAYHLFNYANKCKDNVEKYFVLSHESKQFDSVSQIGKVVEYGSEEHKLLMLFADKIITTHPYDTVINPFLEDDRDLRPFISGLLNFKIYWLQHGVTKDNISDWMYKFDKNLSLIVTVSDEESKSFMQEGYGYDEKIIQNLGFPRFDNLENKDNKQILIVPTWRKNITGNKQIFMSSNYYKNLSSFLNNPKLISMVDKGYNIVFRPHPELMKRVGDNEICDDVEVGNDERFIDLFDIPSVIYVSSEESYQDLFNNSSVLITDYSSVFFDFAYLKKPVIYFHPSNDRYHYKESYFDYETMGFGDIIDTPDDLTDKLNEYIDNGCQMESEYKKRVDKFFIHSDKNNCKRVYDWILKN